MQASVSQAAERAFSPMGKMAFYTVNAFLSGTCLHANEGTACANYEIVCASKQASKQASFVPIS